MTSEREYREYAVERVQIQKEPTPSFKKFIVPQYEIVEYFSSVSSKNEAIGGFIEFGGRCFENLAVFSAFSNSIQFLKGEGENLRAQVYLGSHNIDRNTVFRRALVTKFPYRGTVPNGPDDKELFGHYFNRCAEEIFIYPGSIRGEESDILFYGDGFETERDAAIATFEYIVEKTILALRYLWIKKQLITI